MAKPLTRWRRTRRRNVVKHVGNFFEAVAARVIRARRSVVGHEDLVLRGMTGVEVKAGNSNNPLRIAVDQFEQHVENVGEFPARFDYFLYCLFCYRQKMGRKTWPRRSLLSGCRDEAQVYEVLAQQTDSLYIFDHRVFDAVRKLHGVKQGKMPCDSDREVIVLSRKFLRAFRKDNAQQVLSSLGLDPTKWRINERTVSISFRIGLFKHVLRLPTVEVVPVEVAELLHESIRTPQSRVSSRRLRLVPTTTAA
jgi:hypothetical protein